MADNKARCEKQCFVRAFERLHSKGCLWFSVLLLGGYRTLGEIPAAPAFLQIQIQPSQKAYGYNFH